MTVSVPALNRILDTDDQHRPSKPARHRSCLRLVHDMAFSVDAAGTGRLRCLKHKESALKIAVITGSTRPGRKNETVARWVFGLALKRSDAEFELVDIKDYHLPLLDEPAPPVLGRYSQPHTKVWAAKIASFDAYVFVAPEYNHGTSAALKNAIDYLFREWNNKAAGFVSYGGAGGAAGGGAPEGDPGEFDGRDGGIAGDAVVDYGLRQISPRSARTHATSRKCTRCSTRSSPGAKRCDRSGFLSPGRTRM